jgi:N-acyl-D-aspartate/D-glutamate deacylase
MVDEAMRQGAFGLSSALIYHPGSFATTEELIDLARVVAPYGGPYVSHIRGETDRLPVALDEAVTIGREAGVPVVVFHLKVASKARWGRMSEVVDTIGRARTAGIDVSATQYPYAVAGTSLDVCLPDWVLEGGTAAAQRRLRQPQLRRRIRREIERGHGGWDNFLHSAGFDGVTIVSVPAEADGSVVGQTLEAIAKAREQEPWETFFDLLIEHRLRVSALYAIMHDDDVRVAMRQPWISIGSDSAAQTDAPDQAGRPHPRGFGTFPRVLGHYVRETSALTLPDAVRKMTGFAARQFAIADRGEVRVGAFADLVVFDAATIADRATFDHPRQYPVGIDAVVVNGVVTLRQGAPTGARAGRALRGPAATVADQASGFIKAGTL